MHAVPQQVAVDHGKDDHARDARKLHKAAADEQPAVPRRRLLQAVEEVTAAELQAEASVFRRHYSETHEPDHEQIQPEQESHFAAKHICLHAVCDAVHKRGREQQRSNHCLHAQDSHHVVHHIRGCKLSFVSK